MTPQDTWVTDPSFGVDPAVINTSSAPVCGADTPATSSATASAPEVRSDTPPPPPSGNDENTCTDSPPPTPAAATLPAASTDVPATASSTNAAPDTFGPDAENYQRGYRDGLNGESADPGPLANDSLAEYEEGYAKGKSEFDHIPKEATNAPPPSDESSYGELGEELKEIGKFVVVHKGVEKAVETAARSLFSVGKEAAEFAAGTAGVILTAVELATSPIADTSLAHTIYQAAVMSGGIAVPCRDSSLFRDGIAPWHRKKENAEKDAQAYTAKTGEETTVDEQYSKDPDDED